MLSESKMVAFLFTRDYDKAKAFFVDKLGFEFVSHDQFALVLRCGQNTIRVTKPPNFIPAQGTVLGWGVANVEAAIAWLKQRGVTPEKYPFMETGDEFWTAPSGDKVARFKDPDGNILSASQQV